MNIPTTFEMDGLFTQEDIDNRFYVMKPCTECLKYSQHDIREKTKDCPYCHGMMGINGRYWYSLRTYNMNKRLTATDQKKL